MKKHILFILVALSMIRCTAFSGVSEKTVYIEKVPDEINTTKALKSFLIKNKSPKVVLRVNNSRNKLTENENVEALYSIIEKELMANGFDVRDRQLFNQIVENKDNTINYENLYKKTDTDLIIELMEMSTNVPYSTNIYKDQGTGELKTTTFPYKTQGRSIEFKVIIIKTNQFAGSYKFNFTPCMDGCVLQSAIPSFKELRKQNKYRKNDTPTGYTIVHSKKENEDFVRESTQKLISAMRSN
ncbi:hypothetical protein BPO_0641 [Bergeyella porcorum]|uniref:DUF4136 domain-containing protein n=1 Tax=Bergeyella porcorum TaxID=1735111 RepID=A0AAU0EYI9_9FLAO